MAKQIIEDCPEHVECVTITLDDGGSPVWVSHWVSSICVSHRVNADFPAVDVRGKRPKAVEWSEPCAKCDASPSRLW